MNGPLHLTRRPTCISRVAAAPANPRVLRLAAASIVVTGFAGLVVYADLLVRGPERWILLFALLAGVGLILPLARIARDDHAACATPGCN